MKDRRPDAQDELAWLPAWRLHALLQQRELSPVDLIEQTLRRIEGHESRLHAFITVAYEQARAQAVVAEDALTRGDDRPLLGIPVVLKDDLWTAGLRTTCGSLLYEDFVPAEDSVVASRLREAGAIIVGKTNMPEFAAFPRAINRLAGEARNPWDASRISGASSSGSGAAVAAGLVPLALGTDGGGSTRIPASLCGAFGLHPTIGRVPSRNTFSFSPLAAIGPITRDVRDAATLLQIISGGDAHDPTSFAEPVPDFVSDLSVGAAGLRMALLPDFAHQQVRPEVFSTIEATVETLVESGVAIETVETVLPDVWPSYRAVRNGRVLYAGGPVPFVQDPSFRAMAQRPENLGRLCAYNQEALQRPPVTRSAFMAGEQGLRELWAILDRLFARYDVLITPMMPDVAPQIPEDGRSPYPSVHHGTYYGSIANVTSCAAATYPCGFVDGLPVGLQMIVRPGNEATLLRAFWALEQIAPWTHRPGATAAEAAGQPA